MNDLNTKKITCDYDFGGPTCGAPASKFFSGARRFDGHGYLCEAHFAVVADAVMPLEAQFGKQIDACRALKAAAKAEARTQRKRKVKVCPHCGGAL